MTTEFEKQAAENEIIRRETRQTLIVCLAVLGTMVFYAVLAFFLQRRGFATPAVRKLWELFSIVSIALIIVVLAVRKTIYFSPRLVKDDFTLTALLRKWRVIDILLMALAEVIAVMGLVVSLLGMPFDKTFHFFVGGFLLGLVIMPVGWKVRDKLRNFERYAGRFDE